MAARCQLCVRVRQRGTVGGGDNICFPTYAFLHTLIKQSSSPSPRFAPQTN
uniref:Uncharacterized protein n=1 Tax=Anopheles arabiensis TaxID=7173 RepID=A0A182IF58_ANOAR